MADNPIKIAMKMEVDGISYYTECAEKTNNPLGKKMFLSLVEDEKRHLKALETLFKEVDYTTMLKLLQESSPENKITTVFSHDDKETTVALNNVDPDDIKALETAMQMEKSGYDYYCELAEREGNEDGKKLYELLAREENGHYTLLSNTHTYLNDTGNWFLWGEEGMIDGG